MSETRKIVINNDFGGFGLSHQTILEYAKRKGINLIFEEETIGNLTYYNYWEDSKDTGNYWSDRDIPRDDPILINIVEELGDLASGMWSHLKIVEIPIDVEWILCNGEGGIEWIAEKHRIWE